VTSVAFWSSSGGKGPERIGAIHWSPERGFAFDGDQHALDYAFILKTPVMLKGGELVESGEDPQRFMESLHLQYSGSYLRADPAESDEEF
jgi:hypothetical protein